MNATDNHTRELIAGHGWTATTTGEEGYYVSSPNTPASKYCIYHECGEPVKCDMCGRTPQQNDEEEWDRWTFFHDCDSSERAHNPCAIGSHGAPEFICNECLKS